MNAITDNRDFLINEILRDYNSNSRDEEILGKLRVMRNQEIDRPVVFVGAGTCGLGAGAAKTLSAIQNYMAAKNIDVRIIETGCIGLCSSEPLVDVIMPGFNRVSFENVTEEKVEDLFNAVLNLELPVGVKPMAQFAEDGKRAWDNVVAMSEHPFFKPQIRLVLQNCGVIDPESIDEYIARGGYKSLIKTINTYSSAEVCDLIEKSGLRGRGGGGFLTGMKWKFAHGQKAEQKYLICNADEGDPGAFMDRAVIEGDPHRLIEGMAIAAFGIGATKAYVYIRAEYPLAIKRLKKAIAQAKEYGLIGHNIFESGVDFEINIKMGAGAFVCGEETALIHSIEGQRGMPRPRPPFPTTSGLFGKPTVINNVETLANVSSIIEKGADWFYSIGTENSKGTKVFALSGKIAQTGLLEVPMGTTVRQIIFDIAGGIANNKKFKSVQIGGPSGGCITEANLDIEIDYQSLIAAGAMMGSGGLVVMDEDTCMVDVAKFFMGFIQRESCGKCIPCREGTRRMLEILEKITSKPLPGDENGALERFNGIIQLEKLGEVIRSTSLCGLGQTAPNPVISTLRWFRHEYEAHVFERKCEPGVCTGLSTYTINTENCTGCTACAKKCPTGAIIGAKKAAHYIIEDKCIGCGSCVETCKFDAISLVK